MADQRLVDVLKQGAERWSRWRSENPDVIEPDFRESSFGEVNLAEANLRMARLTGAYLFGTNLREAILSAADLRDANLREANLRKANLRAADLSGADLRGADLSAADLIGARLSHADLRNADLIEANLRGAYLTAADLREADLIWANLSGADLAGTNLETATVGWTLFGEVDLSEAVGLESVKHDGPSTIGIDTIFQSQGNIPERFLREAGVPEIFTTYMASMVGQPIQLYSCFLSHASVDGPFSERLRSDLLANNVSCWHYRHDMRGGQFWRVQINEAIKVHDKLVLICSKASLQRRNVVDEIIAAMERERETGSQKLFPIRLDDFILGDEMLALADEQMAAGQWREDWVRYVRAYHIPDFSRWKRNHDAYQRELEKLLDALKNPVKR